MRYMLPDEINGADTHFVGFTIRARRKDLGWSMAELSRRTKHKIKPRRIGRIERDECDPQWTEALILLETMGVAIDLVLVGI